MTLKDIGKLLKPTRKKSIWLIVVSALIYHSQPFSGIWLIVVSALTYHSQPFSGIWLIGVSALISTLLRYLIDSGINFNLPFPTLLRYLVNSGLSFNLPFPLNSPLKLLLFRPERNVMLYLVFDYSSRLTDLTQPFKVSIIFSL